MKGNYLSEYAAEFENVDLDEVDDDRRQEIEKAANERYITTLDVANDDNELAERVIDQLGGVGQLDRETLESYFNWNAYGRDLRLELVVTESGHVFNY